MLNKKIMINIEVESLLHHWTMPEFDDTFPIQFSDQLAYILFGSAIKSMCYRYYRRGIKNERKKRKHKQIEKYNKKLAEVNSKLTNFVNSQESMPADFKKVVDENFWDLV